jgi:nicotinamidase-related amidase
VSNETHAALLVMDLQEGIVAAVGADEFPVIENIQRAIGSARLHNVPIYFVTLGFRNGHPEVNPRNRMFAGIAQAGAFKRGSPDAAIHPALAPADGDQVVVKFRVSAFAGSDLEVLLRARNIDTLVLTGISTSGVVLSTVREAADKDFRLVVLSDGCFDPDPDLHVALTEKVFSRQADVLNVDNWIERLDKTTSVPT